MTTDTTKTMLTKPARPRPAKMAAPAAKPVLATPPTAPAAKPASKSDTVIKLLLRAKGATPTELIAATDWQPHSLRAFLSGLRKKGRAIVREARKGGEFAYRIVTAPTDPRSDGSAGDGKPLANAIGGTDGTFSDPGLGGESKTADGAGEA